MTDSEKLDLLLSEMTGMKSEMQSMKSEMQSMKSEMQSMKEKVTGIELHLENVTDKNIQLLAESYVPATKRYEKAVPEIQAMQADIEIMKKVISDHSEKLKKIS